MNTKSLTQLYDQLTPSERLPLIIAAAARGDENERQHLMTSASKLAFQVPDYYPRAKALGEAVHYHMLTLLDLAAKFWQWWGLWMTSGLRDGGGKERKKGRRRRVDAEILKEWRASGVVRYYASRFVAHVDGWKRFCTELHIDPEVQLEIMIGWETITHTDKTTTFTLADHADGTGATFTAKADWSVNLFQPSATVSVTASPTTADHLGQVITYTYTLTNTSSSDSPDLVLSTSNPDNFVTDTLLGNLEADAIAAGCGDLAPGASCTFTETRAIQAGDPTPLTNTVNVQFTLAQNLGNFDNKITANASASVVLVPHLSITKAINGPSVVHPGDTASFTITVPNDGAGPATNVLVTDQLPDPEGNLTWTASSSTMTCTINATDFMSCTDATLPAGTSDVVTVSTVIPLDFFGTGSNGGGTGNGDPVPLNLFELDGNATTQTTHDWDQIFVDATVPAPPGEHGFRCPSTGGATSGADACSFISDLSNSRDDDIFTGGGSKDTLGIQQGPWLFTDSKPQAKDDITHAYAAAYTASNGDVILFAGLDRFDNSGDATAGFWFFHNAIGEGTVTKGNGTGPFTGTHSDGDILLVSDFTIGGSVATVTVFKWVGDDATGSLVPVGSVPNTTFAIVNGSATPTGGWSFTNKSGETSFAHGEFLEEGINLTGLGLGGCFSSFLAETRSSQSATATLSDFVVGPFKPCSETLPNTATVQADGIAPITSNQVIITVTGGGSPQLASSVGSATLTETLTDQELQPIVAQAVEQWRAAGVGSLTTLDNMTVHVARLGHGELGWTFGNDVWIDATAQGWGWSIGNTTAQGQMDLLTVVTHELGHVLGYGDDAGPAVMATTLAPGVRRAPEAAPSAPAASTSAVGVQVGQVVRGSEASALPTSLIISQAPPAVLDRTSTAAATATSAGLPTLTPAQGPTSRLESGGASGVVADHEDPDNDDVLNWMDLILSDGVQGAALAAPPAPTDAVPSAAWEQARDAYFAADHGTALLTGRSEALHGASGADANLDPAVEPIAVAGLLVVLGGYIGAPAAEPTARNRRRFQV